MSGLDELLNQCKSCGRRQGKTTEEIEHLENSKQKRVMVEVPETDLVFSSINVHVPKISQLFTKILSVNLLSSLLYEFFHDIYHIFGSHVQAFAGIAQLHVNFTVALITVVASVPGFLFFTVESVREAEVKLLWIGTVTPELFAFLKNKFMVAADVVQVSCY